MELPNEVSQDEGAAVYATVQIDLIVARCIFVFSSKTKAPLSDETPNGKRHTDDGF